MDHDSPLPSDPRDRILAQLIGLPNGAHTQPAVIQVTDFYGNVSQYIVQTIRWEEGCTVFIQIGADKFILPPRVIGLIERQIAATGNMIKRRHGRRLAEARKLAGMVSKITPAMRAKALEARKAKAAKRKARRKQP